MRKFSILFLLLTILVPSMLGYVKKSKEVQMRYEDTVTAYDDYEDNYTE